MLGLSAPGQDKEHQLLRLAQHGPVFWTGAAPSIEGGALAVLLMALAAATLWVLQTRSGHRWDWRHPLLNGEPRPIAPGRSTFAQRLDERSEEYGT